MTDAPENPAYPSVTRPRRSAGMVWLAVAFLAGLIVMALALPRWNAWFRPSTAVPLATTGAAKPAGTIPIIAAPPAPAADLATLTSREAVLSTQLGDLEVRTAAISTEAQQAEGYATRAENLMVAFAARRAIDRGLPLGYIESQLRLRFGPGQPRAVATVLDAARNPVTLEDLRGGLDNLSSRLTTGSPGENWFTRFTRAAGNLVVIHRADTPSPLPIDRLTRARRMLVGGQVEAALAEVSMMPGAGGAQGWAAAARRYVDARRALDALETAALLGQAADITPTPALPPQ